VNEYFLGREGAIGIGPEQCETVNERKSQLGWNDFGRTRRNAFDKGGGEGPAVKKQRDY